jgi:hypothetical protein
MADVQPQGEMTPEPGNGPRHEANEIKVKGILLFALGLVAIGVLIHGALDLVMESYQKKAARDRALRSPFFNLEVEPPGPHLQDNPTADLARFKEQEMRHLTSYGWLDRERGIAHIPIERAMDILARSGLPRVTGPKATKSGPEAEIESRLAPRPKAASPADSGRKP